MQQYDAIVIGVGGMGSSALYHFAKRGLRVIGLDRFPTCHKFGSTHGQTRLIRQAYFEHPDYVPMLKRAYTLWEELTAEWSQKLYHEVGVLQAGYPDGRILPGVLESAKLHDLKIQRLTPGDVTKLFPGFVIPENLSAAFEQRAGYLFVEECVKAHTELALRAGATLQTGETVQRWSASPGRVEVQTDRDTYTASHLVITAGSWANDFLGKLKIPLEVVRKSLYWYQTKSDVYQEKRGSPGFIIECATGNFYGFPQIDELGVKVAEHSNGIPVANPLEVDRTEDAAETNQVLGFIRDFMPQVTTQQTRFDTCLYTLSPDRNFIIDRDPDYPHVTFAAGLSGHGFKFATVLGEVLTEMSLGLPTTAPAEFLSASRPGLRGA